MGMITIQAPAKINLTLVVRGKRADGYHALESVMQMITLADRLELEDADALQFTCSDPALETADNLVVRAATMLRRHYGITRGVRLHLEKNIPAQAGLGGGSSDAAATLLALNEFWQLRCPLDEMRGFAAALGSDVPFFLDGPSALVQGRGETVTPIPHQANCHLVLAKPSAGLSTAEVYARLYARPAPDHLPAHPLPATQAMIDALRHGDPATAARALINTLESPALAMLPALSMLHERMLQQGCLGVLLCGSGSAMFGICPDAATAAHAAIDLRNDCPWTAQAEFLPA